MNAFKVTGLAIVTAILHYGAIIYWFKHNSASTSWGEFAPLLIIPVLTVVLWRGKYVRSETLIGLGTGYGISVLALVLSLVLFIAAWNAAV